MLVKRVIYKYREVLGALGILFSIAIIYWPIIKYPFFADDWQLLITFANLPNYGLLLKRAFNYTGGDPWAFRPIVTLYSALLYIFFGLKPAIFRLFLLSFHFINSLLVMYIVRNITKENLLSWLTAILYATAIRCHFHQLVSAANGFSDVGAIFFALSSFALFLKNRYILSSIVFFLAIYTKPPTALLPLILLSYAVILSPKKINRLWLYLAALSVFLYSLFWVFLRFHQIPLLTFSVKLIVKNISYYLPSLFFILVPLKSKYPYIFLANLVFFLLLFKKDLGRVRNSLFFWKVWFIVALLSICFLTRQLEYYLIYALIPFIVLLLLFFKELFLFAFRSYPYAQLCLLVMVFASVIYSGLWVRREDNKGIKSEVLYVNGPYFIRNVQYKLSQLYPALPLNPVFVFDKVAEFKIRWILGSGRAICIWCRDDYLKICGVGDLHISPLAGVWFNSKGIRPFDKDKTYISPQEPIFLISCTNYDVDIRRISLEELVRLRVAYGGDT